MVHTERKQPSSWDSEGCLVLHILGGQDLPRKAYSKLDPYVQINYDGQSLRSGSHKGSDNYPVWNERFYFKKRALHRGNPQLHLVHQTLNGEVELCQAQVPLEFAAPDMDEPMQVPLKDVETFECCGNIVLSVSLLPMSRVANNQLVKLPYSEQGQVQIMNASDPNIPAAYANIASNHQDPSGQYTPLPLSYGETAGGLPYGPPPMYGPPYPYPPPYPYCYPPPPPRQLQPPQTVVVVPRRDYYYDDWWLPGLGWGLIGGALLGGALAV